jgi:hypothetical protein
MIHTSRQKSPLNCAFAPGQRALKGVDLGGTYYNIGRAEISAGPGRLLLRTDSVHKLRDLVQIKEILAAATPTGETAKALVTAARTTR